MPVTLDQALESVTSNGTVGDSAVALMTTLKTRLDEALSGVTLPPAVQAKVDAIFEASEADKAKIEAAILSNTPNE
jgi:hypothetical protein